MMKAIRKKQRLRNSASMAIPEFIVGGEYEHADTEREGPLIPRPAVDVRSLASQFSRQSVGPLKFLESDIFQFCVGGVIVWNILVVFQQFMHGNTEFLENSQLIILLLYVLEIILRIWHFGRKFFCNTLVEAMWNYADLLIIGLGVFDEVLSRMKQEDVPGFRVLRALRLLRILRTVAVVSVDAFAWVEAGWFQALGAAIIGLNAIVMGLEIEIKSSIWWWLEQAFLLFFFVELIAKLRHEGLTKFFWTSAEDFALLWNYLDSFIVFAGVADQWVLAVLQIKHGSGHLPHLLTLLRLLRLMRLLRLLRLVKVVRPVYQLAMGIVKALQSMFWVLVLTLLALYACALVMTNLIGNAMLSGAEELDPHVRGLFSNVLDSLFTLFGLMNSQYWEEVDPLFRTFPFLKPVWVLFTVLSSWALLSIMTGVVSDNMLEVRQLQERKDEEKAERVRLKVTQALSEVFFAASKDGVMEKQDYVEIMSSPYYLRKLQSVANMPIPDLLRMFDWLDVNQQGSILQEDFMAGFDWLNEAVTGKSLLKLQTSARHRCRKIETRAAALRAEIDSTDGMIARRYQEMDSVLSDLLQRIEAETDRQGQQRVRTEMQAMENRVQIEHYRSQVPALSNTGSKVTMTESRVEKPKGTSEESPKRSGLVSSIAAAASKLASPSSWRSSK
ncbi:unnamed protein product [Effrenium voratum]|nr:unnamed protein product [Effrenium voratum]CAJ1436753.1 unnamed protein product [Effrenium voratum]